MQIKEFLKPSVPKLAIFAILSVIEFFLLPIVALLVYSPKLGAAYAPVVTFCTSLQLFGKEGLGSCNLFYGSYLYAISILILNYLVVCLAGLAKLIPDVEISQAEDKRPAYIYWAAILSCVLGYLRLVFGNLDGETNLFNSFVSPLLSGAVFMIIFPIIAVWISGLKLRLSGRFIYGISGLLLIPVPFFWWHYHTCTGKFCNLIDIYYLGLAGSAASFALFYTLGLYLRRWSFKFALSLVRIESVLIFGAIVFIGFYYQSDPRIYYLEKSFEMPADLQRLVKSCDSVLDQPQRRACWDTAVASYPDMNVCALSKEVSSKKDCLSATEEYLTGIYGFCDADYVSEDDSDDKESLESCWSETARRYPEIDICQLTKIDWQKENCLKFFNKPVIQEEKLYPITSKFD